MFKTIVAALFATAVFVMPAAAQGISDKDSCTQGVSDAQNMRKASDAGAKANAEADNLIEVAEHLCQQGNFVYAEKVLGAVRALLSTE